MGFMDGKGTATADDNPDQAGAASLGPPHDGEGATPGSPTASPTPSVLIAARARSVRARRSRVFVRIAGSGKAPVNGRCGNAVVRAPVQDSGVCLWVHGRRFGAHAQVEGDTALDFVL